MIINTHYMERSIGTQMCFIKRNPISSNNKTATVSTNYRLPPATQL